jgi:hypothetical protein
LHPAAAAATATHHQQLHTSPSARQGHRINSYGDVAWSRQKSPHAATLNTHKECTGRQVCSTQQITVLATYRFKPSGKDTHSTTRCNSNYSRIHVLPTILTMDTDGPAWCILFLCKMETEITGIPSTNVRRSSANAENIRRLYLEAVNLDDSSTTLPSHAVYVKYDQA